MDKHEKSDKLILAAEKGDFSTVETLLKENEYGPSIVDMQNSSGVTALTEASRKGHLEIVETLLKEGANPNKKIKHGNSALSLAVQENHVNILQTLLKAKANPNIEKDNGMTPLMIAAKNNNLEIIKVLLNVFTKANPNIQSKTAGATALMFASSEGNFDIVETLLNSNPGADPNIQKTKSKETALHMASKFGHLDVIAALLDADANPLLYNEKGQLAYDVCSVKNKEKCQKLLKLAVDQKRNTMENLKYIKQTSMKQKSMELITAVSNEQLDVVKMLLQDKTVNVNFQDENGLTALYWASENGFFDIVQVLLSAGANPNIRTNQGNTALMAASSMDYIDVIQSLLQAGVDSNLTNNDGDTALMEAAKYDSLQSIQALLDANLTEKTNPNIQNKEGITALMYAAKKGYLKIIEALLKADVNTMLYDNKGRAAYSFCEGENRVECRKMLQKGISNQLNKMETQFKNCKQNVWFQEKCTKCADIPRDLLDKIAIQLGIPTDIKFKDELCLAVTTKIANLYNERPNSLIIALTYPKKGPDEKYTNWRWKTISPRPKTILDLTAALQKDDGIGNFEIWKNFLVDPYNDAPVNEYMYVTIDNFAAYNGIVAEDDSFTVGKDLIETSMLTAKGWKDLVKEKTKDLAKVSFDSYKVPVVDKDGTLILQLASKDGKTENTTKDGKEENVQRFDKLQKIGSGYNANVYCCAVLNNTSQNNQENVKLVVKLPKNFASAPAIYGEWLVHQDLLKINFPVVPIVATDQDLTVLFRPWRDTNQFGNSIVHTKTGFSSRQRLELDKIWRKANEYALITHIPLDLTLENLWWDEQQKQWLLVDTGPRLDDNDSNQFGYTLSPSTIDEILSIKPLKLVYLSPGYDQLLLRYLGNPYGFKVLWPNPSNVVQYKEEKEKIQAHLQKSVLKSKTKEDIDTTLLLLQAFPITKEIMRHAQSSVKLAEAICARFEICIDDNKDDDKEKDGNAAGDVQDKKNRVSLQEMKKMQDDVNTIRTLRNDTTEFHQKLASHQKAVISNYTSSSYDSMNKCLRESRHSLNKCASEQKIVLLDEILSQPDAPALTAPIVVYRAINPSTNKMAAGIQRSLQALKPGDYWEDRGFVSTSVQHPPNTFTGKSCCIFQIYLPK